MDLRCQNCGERLPSPAPGPAAAREVACPACGATMLVEPRPRAKERRGPEHLKVDEKFRRVYNPIPRSALYIAGAVLVTLLLSPFWVYLIQERYRTNRITLSEETTNIVVGAATNLAPPVFDPNERPALLLDQFHGVRLDANREDLVRRFSLRLQNTRGMEPEIYLAQKTGDLEQLTAYFYGGLLKEAFLALPERRTTADDLVRVLSEQFGAPASATDSPNRAGVPGLGTPGLGGGDAGNDWARKLAGYPFRRDVAWADAQYRVEATIYFTSADPSLCQALPVVHLVSAGWLKSNQPLRDMTTPSHSPNPVIPPPKSLF